MKQQTPNKSIIILMLILLVGMLSIQVKAQNHRVSAYIFQPHWYVGANLGTNMFLSEGWGNYSALESLGFNARAQLGYNVSEVLGARIQAGYYNHNWPDVRLVNPLVSFNAIGTNADLTINLSNLIVGYTLIRPYDINVFGGIGAVYRPQSVFAAPLTTYTVDAGVQADIRLSRLIELNITGELNITSDKYNDFITGMPVELFPALSIGLTYHFRNHCGTCGR